MKTEISEKQAGVLCIILWVMIIAMASTGWISTQFGIPSPPAASTPTMVAVETLPARPWLRNCASASGE